MSKDTTGNKMWGGRFASGQDDLMEEINASIDFDKRLAEQDILASKTAWFMGALILKE